MTANTCDNFALDYEFLIFSRRSDLVSPGRENDPEF